MTIQKLEDIRFAKLYAVIANGYSKKQLTYKDFMPRQHKKMTDEEMLQYMITRFNLEDPRKKG